MHVRQSCGGGKFPGDFSISRYISRSIVPLILVEGTIIPFDDPFTTQRSRHRSRHAVDNAILRDTTLRHGLIVTKIKDKREKERERRVNEKKKKKEIEKEGEGERTGGRRGKERSERPIHWLGGWAGGGRGSLEEVPCRQTCFSRII